MSCHVVRNPDQPNPGMSDTFIGPPQPDWVALGLTNMEYGEYEANHEWWEDPRRCSCSTPEYTNHTNEECYAVATQEDGLCDVCRIWNQTTNKAGMFDQGVDPYLKARRWEERTESSPTSKEPVWGTSYGELYDLRTYGSEET